METDKTVKGPQAFPPAAEDMEDQRLLRISDRPDGYHWTDIEGRQEFGPYATLDDALLAMDDAESAMVRAIEQNETTEEAEQGLGIDAAVDRTDEDEPEGPA